MLSYQPPLRDLRFALDVAGYADLLAIPGFAHADLATVDELLGEFGRLMTETWSPTNESGDREGLRVDLGAGTIGTPAGFAAAYQAYVTGGWGAVGASPDHGGGGFPHMVSLAMSEMVQASNMALALCPMLTQGAIEALEHHGSEAQKERYLRRLITGEWTGTMNLTEPDAGSDVGAVRARAVQDPDGTWRIFGQKIYITWGEHDLADNIVHLVLARVSGAPPGTKGISCFIVPKFVVQHDGSLGARNDVRLVSTEHKMGIHASPTCVLAFGDNGVGAVGELIGEVNAGMRCMFTMMNNARLAVGQEGVALAERAYQHAVAHALVRVQGRPVTTGEPDAPIVHHPDVRRMLLTMRSHIEAMRLLIFENAKALDLGRHAPDPYASGHARDLADLLTPLSKAWCTDLGSELCSLAVQIHGGMGFVEDTGVAQLYRDIRIAAIYEGTNGIQALDLVGRKLGMRDGAVMGSLIATMRNSAAALAKVPSLAMLEAPLTSGIDACAEATEWMLTTTKANAADAHAGATPFLRMVATVVGGWLLARQALEAKDRAAVGDADGYYAAKVATAAFFIQQIVPAVHGLRAQIFGSWPPLAAVGVEQLASR